MLTITPSGEACGAEVAGVDLSRPLERDTRHAIRRAWLQHKVLAFPDQHLDEDDLERLVLDFGRYGDEPFFVPIEGRQHVVALTRRADESAPVFAEAWHADWSFQAEPPIGTCLYSRIIPPVGGETSFVNQEQALAEMPAGLRDKLHNLVAQHSAAAAYAPEGLYGEREHDSDRSMTILYSEDARALQSHPLIQRHPETGRDSLYGCLGYIVGIEGMDEEEAAALLLELYEWQTRPEFQYTHRWRENMFVIWDNRVLLHRANGGYDGYARELHRTTVAADPARFLSHTGAARN